MDDTYEQVRKRTFRVFKGQNLLDGYVRIASAKLKKGRY